MPNSWPPPPDLYSLAELIASADIEGFLADGGPADEYDVEAKRFYNAIHAWPTADLTVERLLPVLEGIWTDAFGLDDCALEQRRVKLRELAGQVERFFGPGASPQVRKA